MTQHEMTRIAIALSNSLWILRSGAAIGADEAFEAGAMNRCEIHLPYRENLSQQHGFFHGGVTTTIADSACGYAGFTLMPADSSVLTIEYKVNFLAPADGDLLIATGTVVKPGRAIIVSEARVVVVKDGRERACASMTETMMVMQGLGEKE